MTAPSQYTNIGSSSLIAGFRFPVIATANYWDSDRARAGYLHLICDASGARILVPDSQQHITHEMVGTEVIVSRGAWIARGRQDAIELAWVDGSDAPFSMLMTTDQTDGLPSQGQQGGGFIFTASTRDGPVGRWPGRYRFVSALPCCQPWNSH